MNPSVELRAGIYSHGLKYKARGEPMPCCVVVGDRPAVSYTAVQTMPEHLEEMAVAGGLVGRAIKGARARPVDLPVLSEPEVGLGGCIVTELLDPESPSGTSPGHGNIT